MKTVKYISLIILGICFSQLSRAQFSLSGEIRPRTEVSRGYKSLATKGQDASISTTQRTRLNFAFKTDFIKTQLVLQDIRNWGEQPQLSKNHDFATSVHQAWAELFFTPELSIKAGRQELAYDDQRIIGVAGWAQQARSHDVALLKYENDIKLHLGIAHYEDGMLKNNIYSGPAPYKNLQFLWLNNKWENISLSLLALNNGVPTIEEGKKQSVKYSQTIGGHLKTKFKSVNLASNLYYQTGEHVSGKDISALNFLVELSSKNVTVGFEHLSGRDYDDRAKIKSFTPFYGTNHKFNGLMDYFFTGNHINSVGLNNAYVKYKYSKKKFGISAHLHYFGAAAKISENTDSYLGTELDLAASWAVKPMAKLSVGLSTLFASDSMEQLKGGDKSEMQTWAYVMLSIKPSFIN